MSHAERDTEIGRVLREHGERRQEYLALSAKLKRIAGPLSNACVQIQALDNPGYPTNNENAKAQLGNIAGEVELGGLLRLLNEHIALSQRLREEVEALREYGVER
jgi:hypothetical protein